MKKVLAVISLALVATGAMAGSKPFQASLTPDYAIYDRMETINGLSLSIWGENPQAGLALGLVNGSTGHSVGVSLGVFNYADYYKGLQWGIVNYTKQDFSGWQGGPFFGLLVSVVNYTGGTMTGFQCGAVNYAGTVTGLQLGIFNYAAAADDGVQIGLINIIHENTQWFSGLPDELAPGMVLVNWRF